MSPFCHGDNDLSLGERVDPATWKRIKVKAPKASGGFAYGDLLRPMEWLDEEAAEVGETVYLSVPECGIDGDAEVLSIEPCPPVVNRPGARVVTGTWRHEAATVIDLRIEGLESPIGVTANHPIWSEDRKEFVRADELRVGEKLLSLNGDFPSIRSSAPRAGAHEVFNLEVQLSHVYQISHSGILVHNSGVCGDHSEILRENMIAAGKDPLTGKFAAHLVPSTGWSRRNARVVAAIDNVQSILNDARIGTDHAANGIFTNSANHLGTHRNTFILFLETELTPHAGNRGALLDKLNSIGNDLITGALKF